MGEKFIIPDKPANDTIQNFSNGELYEEEKKLFKALEKKENKFVISRST